MYLETLKILKSKIPCNVPYLSLWSTTRRFTARAFLTQRFTIKGNCFILKLMFVLESKLISLIFLNLSICGSYVRST